MGIQIQGNSGVVAEVSGTGFRAFRTESRPLDHAALGHYRFSQVIPLVATQAANGTLLSWRWGDATRLAVLTKLRIGYMQTVAATATIMPVFEAVIARGFSVSDSIGTAITPATNSMKKRTNMGASLVTDVRFATVAAGLTVGTRTLDPQALMHMMVNSTITTPNPIFYERELELDLAHGAHPYVFAQNEGLVVKGPSIIFGAAGAGNLIVDMSWAELAAF